MKRLIILLTITIFLFPLHALAQKSGSRWVSLFDGKTLKGWEQVTGTAGYKVIDGNIVGTVTKGTINSFLATKALYKDFILELETKIEDTAVNSGIQLRSHVDPAKGKVTGLQYEIDGTSRRWSAGI